MGLGIGKGSEPVFIFKGIQGIILRVFTGMRHKIIGQEHDGICACI
jgi:hypothetical protein